jgi:hypothetical protein
MKLIVALCAATLLALGLTGCVTTTTTTYGPPGQTAAPTPAAARLARQSA